MQKDTSRNSASKIHFSQEIALKKFFDSAPMMMGIAEVRDNDIRHISDNDMAARFFRTTSEEMEGKFASELGVSKKNLDLWIQKYQEAERTGTPIYFEYSPDIDSQKILSAGVSFMEKSEDGYSRFCYIVKDITIQRTAHTKLGEAKAKLEKEVEDRTRSLELEKKKLHCLLQAAPVGIAFVDTEMNYEVINPVLAKLNGLPAEDHLKKNITEILSDKANTIRPILQDILKTGKKYSNFEFEYQIASDNNKTHYFIGNYFPVALEDQIVGVGAIIQDITERKNAENELRISEAKTREIANAMPQIVWTATPEGFVDWYNDQWYEFTGAKRGSHWDDKDTPMHPDDVEPTHKRWKESIDSGEPYQMEYRFKRKSDGEYRWHLGRATPIKDKDGKILRWIGSNTDIHEQKLLVKKLETEHDLREYFITTLTHDLRTPLTAAKMSAQLLARKSDDIAVNKSSMRIVENMDRADSMIQDLLDATRIKAGEKLPVQFVDCNLTQIAVDTINELSTIHGDRFLLNAKMDIEGHWSCKGLRRIIENLCTNAVKYGSTYSPVSVSISEQNKLVNIEVHNEGNPIPKDELKKLFEPFRRAESAQTNGMRGWGIGLTLVKGLVKAHKGKVSVKSTMEHGTTFIVSIPKNPEAD